MNNTGTINSLPPAYIEPDNIQTWLLDIFDGPLGIPCICGDQTVGRELAVVRPRIINVCQRPAEPCKIDIEFHLGTAQGIYFYQPNASGFSFDTTNGRDGTWHQLRTDKTDPNHNPSLNNTTLALTDEVDATWNHALFDPTNPMHTSDENCEVNWAYLGIPVHRFTYDMCEHVSTWLQETKVSFRLSFDKQRNATVPEISCGVQFS